MRIHCVVVLVHGWDTFLVQVVIHVDAHVWMMSTWLKLHHWYYLISIYFGT
jgi:hypothetical protein